MLDEQDQQHRSGSWERALAESRDRSLKSGDMKKSKDAKGENSPSSKFDDSISDISRINKKLQSHEKEDKNQTMQKGAPMRKPKGM